MTYVAIKGKPCIHRYVMDILEALLHYHCKKRTFSEQVAFLEALSLLYKDTIHKIVCVLKVLLIDNTILMDIFPEVFGLFESSASCYRILYFLKLYVW
jgi:hypothetical protein